MITVRDWSNNAATCTSIITVLPNGPQPVEEPVILNRGAETNLAEQGLVMAVFPNPAIDETMVYFELSESAEFRLTAYDMAGRVRMVVDQPGEKGENTLRLDTRSWSPGLYWLKLQTGQDEKIKSLMIQR